MEGADPFRAFFFLAGLKIGEKTFKAQRDLVRMDS